MKLINSIARILASIIFLINGKQMRSNGKSLVDLFSQKIYNFYMGKIFNCNDVDFHRPMNLINGAKYFKIGSGTYFGKFCALTAWDNFLGVLYNPKIVIGTECGFNDYLHLTCINQIIIGNNVRCGRWVTISDNNHGKIDADNLRLPPNKRILYSKGPIIIENRVWIGDKTTILGGVHIGEGSVIGANSVVTKDIPAYCVAVGNPAKVIKKITTLNE